MVKKIVNHLKLLVLFVLTVLKVVFFYVDLKKIKNLFMAFVAQTKNLMNSFCNQNPIKYSYLFRSSTIIANYSEFQLTRLKNVTSQLYQTQKNKTGRFYKYSILIPVYKPKLDFFKILIESCLAQSVSDVEILLGFDGPQPEEISNYVKTLLSGSFHSLKAS